MARDFDGTDDKGSAGSPSALRITDVLTLACWFRSDTLTLANRPHLMGLGYDGTNTGYAFGWNQSDLHADSLEIVSFDGLVRGAYTTRNWSSSPGTGTWIHGVAQWDGSAWRLWVDGTEDTNAEGTQSAPASSTANFYIGAQDENGTPVRFYDGRIAGAAVWNVALNQNEITMLARGIDPGHVRPSSLVAHWPLWGLHSPEIDLTSSNLTLTLTGTALANHAPMVPFSWYWWGTFAELGVTNQTATPGVATVAVSGVAPAVVVGTVTVGPSAATVTVSGVAPATSVGGMSAAPGVATVVVSGVAPATVQGSVTGTPGVTTVAVTGVNASASTGGMSPAPGAAVVSVTAAGAAAGAGGVAATPGVAVVAVFVTAPAASMPGGATPGVATVAVSGVSPGRVPGVSSQPVGVAWVEVFVPGANVAGQAFGGCQIDLGWAVDQPANGWSVESPVSLGWSC